jgi:predicted transcriptional regulator
MAEIAKMPSAKEAARQIIEHLPEQASWDDIMYELYVKQKIEEGLADIEAGRTIPHEQVKAELLGRGD